MRPARQFTALDLIPGIARPLTPNGGSIPVPGLGRPCDASLCHHNLYLESEPLVVAYVLQHTHETDGCEETKFIGVYRSREAAHMAMGRLRLTPGFRDYPKAFSIDEYRLDEDHWTEGFV